MTTLKLSDPGEPITVGRWKKRIVNLDRTFEVLAGDVVIGKVKLEMETFERRTAGKRYVNSRWQSPRWFYYLPDSWRRSAACDSKKQAVEALEAHHSASVPA